MAACTCIRSAPRRSDPRLSGRLDCPIPDNAGAATIRAPLERHSGCSESRRSPPFRPGAGALAETELTPSWIGRLSCGVAVLVGVDAPLKREGSTEARADIAARRAKRIRLSRRRGRGGSLREAHSPCVLPRRHPKPADSRGRPLGFKHSVGAGSKGTAPLPPQFRRVEGNRPATAPLRATRHRHQVREKQEPPAGGLLALSAA
jgi:hypothetical protein